MEWWIIIPVAIFLHLAIGLAIPKVMTGTVWVNSYKSFAFVALCWEICAVALIGLGIMLLGVAAVVGMQ